MRMSGHPIDHLREFANSARTDPRKLAMAILSQVLIFVGAILASRFGVISGSYDIMVGGIVAVLTVYITGQAYQGMKIGGNLTGIVAKMTSVPAETVAQAGPLPAPAADLQSDTLKTTGSKTTVVSTQVALP